MRSRHIRSGPGPLSLPVRTPTPSTPLVSCHYSKHTTPSTIFILRIFVFMFEVSIVKSLQYLQRESWSCRGCQNKILNVVATYWQKCEYSSMSLCFLLKSFHLAYTPPPQSTFYSSLDLRVPKPSRSTSNANPRKLHALAQPLHATDPPGFGLTSHYLNNSTTAAAV